MASSASTSSIQETETTKIDSEETEEELIRKRALRDWRALLAVLLLKQTAGPEDVIRKLWMTPNPHVQGVQLILRGSGHATPELDADGDPGQQTAESVRKLHIATREE